MKKSNPLWNFILVASLLLQAGAFGCRSHAAPGDVDLSFDPGSGINGGVAVELQQNTNLNASPWTPPPETITDNGTIKTVNITPAPGERFFRLFKP